MYNKFKRFFSMVLAITLALTLCIPVSASNVNTLTNGYYSIKAVCNGKYFDAGNGSFGSQIQIWDYNLDQRNQTFYISEVGNYWAIYLGSSNYVIAVEDSSNEDRASLVLQNYSGADNQLWKIISNGDKTFSFVNKNSDKYMDVYNGDSANGTRMIQFYSHGGINQKFELVDLNNRSSYREFDDSDEIEMVIDDEDLEYYVFHYNGYTVYNYTNIDLTSIPVSGKTYLANVQYLYANTVLDWICDQLVSSSEYKAFIKAARKGRTDGSVNNLIVKTYSTFTVQYDYDNVYITSTDTTRYIKWTKNNRIKTQKEYNDWTTFEYV